MLQNFSDVQILTQSTEKSATGESYNGINLRANFKNS